MHIENEHIEGFTNVSKIRFKSGEMFSAKIVKSKIVTIFKHTFIGLHYSTNIAYFGLKFSLIFKQE